MRPRRERQRYNQVLGRPDGTDAAGSADLAAETAAREAADASLVQRILAEQSARVAGDNLKADIAALGAAAFSNDFADLIGAADVQAIEALVGTGMAARTADETWALRTITGDTEIVVVNGGGVAGNPTLTIGAGIARVSATVTSITGAPQLLVNGTSGTPQTGAVTLSLGDWFDQPVASTSQPFFDAITVQGTGTIDADDMVSAITFRITNASSPFGWTTNTLLWSDSDGSLRLTNQANDDFGLLMFGGSTLGYPALKRSGAVLQARLADDSDFANVAVGDLAVNGALTVGGTAAVLAGGALIDTTALNALTFSATPTQAEVVALRDEVSSLLATLRVHS